MYIASLPLAHNAQYSLYSNIGTRPDTVHAVLYARYLLYHKYMAEPIMLKNDNARLHCSRNVPIILKNLSIMLKTMLI